MAERHLFRMTLDLTIEDHKRLKTMAALSGKSMRDVIVEALERFYKEPGVGEISEKPASRSTSKSVKKTATKERKAKMPNTQTRKVLDEIKRGEGLVECKNIDDLFKKLGI